MARNDKPFQIKTKIAQNNNQPETMFLMPAQRVITLRTGWPLPFSDYGIDTSFVAKNFSESMRQLMNWGLTSDVIFPSTDKLNQELIKLLNASIFKNATVVLEKGLQKRVMLELENKKRLPFMVWSTGQREFVPLLLGLYWLLSTNMKKNQVKWVVIEEPEMGLHPKAISAVLLFLIQLLHQGYKLIISTHSAHVLDVVWAIQEIKRNQATPELFLEIFDACLMNDFQETAQEIVNNKQFKTYYFSDDKDGTYIKDISELELSSEEISCWGGLTEFSSKIAHVVAKSMPLS
ncbi:MAG: AAA family ATPase [Pseudomonadota bacterium]